MKIHKTIFDFYYKKLDRENFLSYVNISHSLREFLEIFLFPYLLKEQKEKSSMRLLVCGAGLGDFAASLEKEFSQVVGIDISPHAVEWAKRRFPSITFIEGDVGSLNLDIGSFDCVVDEHCLHCLCDEKQQSNYLKNVQMLLPKGGYFLGEVLVSDAGPFDWGKDFKFDENSGILWREVEDEGLRVWVPWRKMLRAYDWEKLFLVQGFKIEYFMYCSSLKVHLDPSMPVEKSPNLTRFLLKKV